MRLKINYILSNLILWRLNSPVSLLFTQPFIQSQIKENCKAPRHWPLCGKFTSYRWIPVQMASYTANVSIWWRHHGTGKLGSWDAWFESWPRQMTSSNGNIFRAQRPVTRSFDDFFDLHLNKWISKPWWGWWFEASSRPLWRHSNVLCIFAKKTAILSHARHRFIS